MTFRFGATPGNLNDIAPDDILAFVAQPAPTRSCRVVSWPTHLRSLFRFLFWSGKTRRNLALSIPRSARSDSPDLPCHLASDEIRQLTEAVHTDNALGRRNHTMLLLMARLGLRAPEVIAIRLEDTAWRAGEILIRGKGKRYDRMPLPVDVGEAIVAYPSRWSSEQFASPVRLQTASSSPVHLIGGCQPRSARGLRKDRLEATPAQCPHPPATSQPRGRHAGQGSVAAGDRRCSSPSVSHDDHDLRPI